MRVGITWLLLASGLVHACRTADTPRSGCPHWESDAPQSPTRALEQFFEAASTGDWEAVATMLAPDFLFLSDGLTALNREQFLDAMRGDDMQVRDLRLSDVRVEMSKAEDVALLSYRLALESSIGGRPYNVETVETVVLERRTTRRWMMLHNHASIQPLQVDGGG